MSFFSLSSASARPSRACKLRHGHTCRQWGHFVPKIFFFLPIRWPVTGHLSTERLSGQDECCSLSSTSSTSTGSGFGDQVDIIGHRMKGGISDADVLFFSTFPSPSASSLFPCIYCKIRARKCVNHFICFISLHLSLFSSSTSLLIFHFQCRFRWQVKHHKCYAVKMPCSCNCSHLSCLSLSLFGLLFFLPPHPNLIWFKTVMWKKAHISPLSPSFLFFHMQLKEPKEDKCRRGGHLVHTENEREREREGRIGV